MTATLTGGGTGKVTFIEVRSGTVLGTSSLTGAQAQFSTLYLGTGTNELEAVYTGDTTHFESTSNRVTQIVNANTAVGLLQSINPYGGGQSTVSADFNGDGIPDVAVFSGQYGATPYSVAVWLDGAFGTAIFSPLGTLVPATRIAVGDFNGDGKPDLAFGTGAPYSTTRQLFVITGKGDGTFNTPVEVMSHAIPYSNASTFLLIGDFNGDGKADIFNPPYMLLGNGDGTFQPVMDLTPAGDVTNSAFYQGAAIGDFNGDGITDFAYISDLGPIVSVELGTGSGTFQSPVSYTFATAPTFLLAGDFNGDGNLDLAASFTPQGANQTVAVLLGKGDGTFPTTVVSTTAPPPPCNSCTQFFTAHPVALDFNGDGKLDLFGVDGAVLSLGNGDGTFQPPINYGSGLALDVAVGDFNGDGRPDVAMANGFYFGASAVPALAATVTNNGRFVQGGTASYTVTLTNSGDAAATQLSNGISGFTFPLTSGGITATGIDPATGWTCTTQQNPPLCYNSNSLASGASFPPVTVHVSIAANATSPQQVVLSAFLWDAPLIPPVTDVIPIQIQPAVLQISKTHTGSFAQGSNGIYTITVSNGLSATGPTSGTVTMTETVPTGMTLVSMGGSGWDCSAGITCTRSDSLAVGANYPAITVTVAVAANAPSSLVNSASASGGASPVSATASDTTTILRGQGISFAPLPDVPVGTAPFTVSASASSGQTVAFTSTTSAVCTVSGITVTILISGGCSIVASQPGNGVYGPAAPVTQSFTVYFSDVASIDNDYAAINAMAQHGITSGCGNNGFCPNDNVRRDEMAIFIVRAIYGNDNFTYTTTPYFTDVAPGAFGFKWIQKLKDLGITSGCTATTYCPADTVARDEMAVFIIRARLGVSIAGPSPTFTYPSAPYFTDATVDTEFAFPWIQRMKLENITSGCTATTYCGTDPVTRGEMAIFIMRGAFNQFLPAGTPVISQISPATLALGASGTFTITGTNTNFSQATTTLSAIPGVTIGAITVTSPTTMTVELTAAANAVAQPYSILAITGTEEDVLPNGLTLQ